MTYVKAVLGTTRSVDTAIQYHSSAPTVTFTCTGTTLDYSCKMNGEDMLLAKEYANFFKMVFHDFGPEPKPEPKKRMSDAPGEFLAGWVYGVSFQKDDIRNDIMSCIKFDDDLTNDMYDGMEAYEKGDQDTGKKKMDAAQKLYETALSGCDTKVTDPIKMWGDKMTDLVARNDWEDFEKKVYEANKMAIDENIREEFQEWDWGVYFNAGMFAGRIDKIFLDAQ